MTYSIHVDLCKYCSLNPRYIIQTTRVPAYLYEGFIVCLKTFPLKMLLEVTQVPAFGRTIGLLQPRKVSADFPATTLCSRRERPGNTCSFYPLLPTFCCSLVSSGIWFKGPRFEKPSNSLRHGLEAMGPAATRGSMECAPQSQEMKTWSTKPYHTDQTFSLTTLQKPPWHVQYLWSSFKNL